MGEARRRKLLGLPPSGLRDHYRDMSQQRKAHKLTERSNYVTVEVEGKEYPVRNVMNRRLLKRQAKTAKMKKTVSAGE